MVGRSKVWRLAQFADGGRQEVECCVCKARIKYVGNTTNIARHLEIKHPLEFAALDPLNTYAALNARVRHEQQAAAEAQEQTRREESAIRRILEHHRQELKRQTGALSDSTVVSAGGCTTITTTIAQDGTAKWAWHVPVTGSSNEDRSGDGASTTEESMLGPDLLAPPETEQAVSPNPTTPSQQKPESYQLRHNNHMTLVLESLAQDEAFMDVTLTAQGRSIRAHKSVLSAVSPYFRGVLCENPCQHPIIIMPRDVRFDELQSIITYIYKGEMTVAAEDLSSLLKTAEILQVTGLTPADPQAAAAAAAASFNPQFSGSSDTPRTSKPRTYLYAQPKSQDTINPTDFMDMDMTCVKEEVMSGDEDGDEDEQDSASYPSQNIPHSKGNEPHHTSITQTSSTSSMTTATPSTQTRHTSDANVNPDPCTSPIKEDDEDLSSCQNPMSKEDPDPFVCPHCKEISRGYEALTLHLKVKHPSKLSFPCFCGRVYLRHARYVDHTKCCISQAPGSS